MMTSIIITYHNEGLDFLMECIDQIRDTIDIPNYEIIVVDDCSEIPIPRIKGVGVVNNNLNIGLGQSYNEGINNALGENIILVTCDIRFIDNNWASRLVKSIEENPKSLISTGCVILNDEHRDVRARIKAGRVSYGATLLVYRDKSNDPLKKSGQGILESRWARKQNKKIYEVATVLGAFYGIKKSWWRYIDGAWGHIKWGNTDSLLGIKSWLFGGSCLVNTEVKVGHIFRNATDKQGKYINHHDVKEDIVFHNKALIAELFFENPEELYNFVSNKKGMDKGLVMIQERMEEIAAKRKEYLKKTEMTIEEYAKKFDIDLRAVRGLKK